MMVTIIQHVEPEGPGTIGEVLRARGREPRLIRTYAGESVPSSLDGTAGLVVMGGPMGVGDTREYPYLMDVKRLVLRALGAGLPVLGVCLGSQLLASVLGAPVRPGPRKEIGWLDVTLTDAAQWDLLFTGVPRTFEAFHWHGDVFDLPADAVSLASSAATACQAFRWGERAYGLLFHLEVDAAALHRMIAAFPGELAEAGLESRRLLEHIDRRVSTSREIGTTVFERWAALTT